MTKDLKMTTVKDLMKVHNNAIDLIVSFDAQKFLIFMKYNSSIYSFVAYVFEIVPKNY